MIELIGNYIKKYGYNPNIIYSRYFSEKQLLFHLKESKGKEIIVKDNFIILDRFTVEYK